MAKELPYFRFEPSEWDNGNIQICSRESKGLFIDLCSIYWSRLGELPYALALQKLCNGNEVALQELNKNDIFGVIDGNIVIEFLDEQLEERGQTSDKRRKAAEKRWSNASALQMESKSNANRIEEKRKENKKEEDNLADKSALLKKYELDFRDQLVPYIEIYGKVMLRAFFDYWVETNKSGTKMRFQMEKTWDIEKRLVRWSNNNFKQNGKSVNQTYDKDKLARLIEAEYNTQRSTE